LKTEYEVVFWGMVRVVASVTVQVFAENVTVVGVGQ
jgi:hypothetical protein